MLGVILMDGVKEIILQTKNVEYIKRNLGKEQWIQVSGHKDMNAADAGFWCGLVSLNHIDEVYNDVGWDVSANEQGNPGFEGNEYAYQYKANLLKDGFESILYYRDFHGVEEDYIELSQEFILLNNLRYNKNSKSYWAMYENGESEEAVKYIDATTIQIKMKFLRNYSSAKQMAILLFFDIRTKFDGKISDFGLEEFNTESKDNGLFYGLWGGDMNFPTYVYSVLMGKKILMPAPIEECGYWPYEKEESYEDFIIGVDEFGKEIFNTCNPNKLNNYFGSNPDAPMYLTPVFFKRDVLQKYVNKPELYEIRDGYLSCQSLWGIEIDNHHKNCVAVYLGDLGRDLPESERGYWKSYNIVGEEGVSQVSFQRDICNIFTESNMEDHKFQVLYGSLIKQWNTKYGWDLYLPLSVEDQYNLTQIRIPLGESQPEFDQLVLSLVKVLIDSLNEKQLIVLGDVQTDIKGISKLERWIQSNEAVGYENHIKFLRDLQKLRSTGSGHRKGKEYSKISNTFGLSEKSKIDVFEEVLRKSNDFLKYMKTTFLD
ncbi:hypothetical protein HMPREF3033_00506 [Veillonellaceae bacterium DNF00751]|nr:hypothetical protein HMPREF3033_00506 [Veillonellaceae bacterium DNF00751]